MVYYIPKSSVQFGRNLGTDKLGQVYEAEHTDWGPVTVKVLNVQSKFNKRPQEELKKDVEKVYSLHHPNVTSLMGCIWEQVDGRSWCYGLVYEPVNCGTLEEYLHKQTADLAPAVVLNIAIQVATGMNYIHTVEPPITHRELSVRTVRLDDHNDVKICDVGMWEWASIQYNSASSEMRQTGYKDILYHLPPEAFRGSYSSSKEANVYMYSILLWMIMTRQQPFSDVNDIMQCVDGGGRPATPTVTDPVRRHIVELMVKCWPQDPAQRLDFRRIKDSLTRLQNTPDEALSHDGLPSPESGETARKVVNLPTAAVPGEALTNGFTSNAATGIQPYDDFRISQVPSHHLSSTSVSAGCASRQFGQDDSKEFPAQPSAELRVQPPPLEYPPDLDEDAASERTQRSQYIMNRAVTSLNPYTHTEGVGTTSYRQLQVQPDELSVPGLMTVTGIRPDRGHISFHNVKGINCQMGNGNVMNIGGSDTMNSFTAYTGPKKSYTITDSLEIVDDVNMQRVAQMLGSQWTTLARKLGFYQGEIDAFNHDYHIVGLQEIIYQLLLAWKRKRGRGATLKALADALIQCDNTHCLEVASSLVPTS